jgi:hypothetical protein
MTERDDETGKVVQLFPDREDDERVDGHRRRTGGFDEARRLAVWSRPTERTKTELCFGRKWSVSVDLEKGTSFDHEAHEAEEGGVLDAFKMRLSGIHSDRHALAWLRAARRQPAGNPHVSLCRQRPSAGAYQD